MSETSLCRERLKKYCQGYGLDIGYGGDPIVPTAITVDRPKPYASVGKHPLNLGGDARKLYWFKKNVLDYVYSSHLLEDFPENETKKILEEWLRVVKPGGVIVLYLPDEQIYRAHCARTGQPYNHSHKIANFSLNYILDIVKDLNVTVVHSNKLCEVYSFEIVVRKNPESGAPGDGIAGDSGPGVLSHAGLVSPNPDTFQGYRDLAQAAEKCRDWRTALAYWDECRKRFPSSMDGWVGAANANLKLRQADEAERIFSGLVAQHPGKPPGYEGLARVAMVRNDWETALARWNDCREKFPDSLSAWVGSAGAMLQLRHLDQAERIFTDLAARYPDKPHGDEGLARIAKRRGDWNLALARWDRLVKLMPETPRFSLGKLEALLELDRNEDFEALWSSANSRFPDNLGLESLRVKISGRLPWRQLADASPPAISGHFDFVRANECIMASIVLSRWAEAETLLRFALEKTNRHPWFTRTYGEMLLLANRPAEAFPLWEEAYTANHSDVGAIAGFAKSLLQLNQRVRALQLFAEVLNANPESITLRTLKSRLLMEPLETASAAIVETGGIHRWLHSGDLGDVVYALPSVRAGGGGELYLVCSHKTTAPMSRGKVEFLNPLLECQPYIQGVRCWEGENIDRDFTDFRLGNTGTLNLAVSQAQHVIPGVSLDLEQAWITLPGIEKHGRPVFARSHRYRNPEWEGFWETLKSSAPDAIFVGTAAEYKDFAHGEHYFAKDALDLAKIIAGASVFVGNQSFPYAIAEGLKVERVLEVFPRIPNCSFAGANCIASFGAGSSGSQGDMAERALALLSKGTKARR